MQTLVEFTGNNPLLVSGLIASALAVIFNELRLKARAVSALSPLLAVRVINDGAAVVDIRAAEQYATGHIVDAHNIPEKELTDNASALDRFKKSILLVCDTGGKSAECAKRLRDQGNERVFSLKGGLTAWGQDNLPLTSKD